MIIEILIVCAILWLLLYRWSNEKFKVLSARGIPHKKPRFLIGNLSWKMLFGRDSYLRTILEIYKDNENCKVFGSYNMSAPTIFIRDLELIKKIAIKDFNNFQNHQSLASSAPDDIFSKGLLALKDRTWKNVRNTLTPSFTGSKMRLMYELINECSIEAINYIADDLKSKGQQQLEVDMKDYFTRFTNDVIATAAFGLKINSFKDRTNQFYTTGSTISSFRASIIFKVFLVRYLPRLTKLLGITVTNEKLASYFRSLVLDAMKYRQAHDILRPDMIQLLMEAKKHFDGLTTAEKVDYADFDDKDMLVAQCLFFFVAGFETVSTCLCFTTYELLMNLDVQQKLYEEILEMQQQLDGKPITYDALMKMKYLDMVISESLRKWPPAMATDRICANDYMLSSEDGSFQLLLKKDEGVMIPIVGIQRDEKYFSEPDKFLPERFSDENKNQIDPMAYMPFGIGPRSCIGNRFALMETKSILYHMLLNFKIVPSDKTAKDLLHSIKGLQSQPLEGYWANLIKR